MTKLYSGERSVERREPEDSGSPLSTLVSRLGKWLLSWWGSGRTKDEGQSTKAGDGDSSFGLQPSSFSSAPACCQLADLELDTVKIEIEAPPVYVVIGTQRCPSGAGWIRRERQMLTLTEAEQCARRLAVYGFHVDVLRSPGVPADARRYVEPLFGYRPAIAGSKTIGVG